MPKSELQKRIDGDLIGLAAGSALSGSSGGAGGGVDHGALVGLLDDDHPQYPGLTQAETITGNWTFNPAGAPFAIGASATGQLVAGLNADQVDGLDEPDLLLVDGSNALTGNLSVDPGITIDGVDLSVHAADPNAHHNQVHNIVGSDHTLTASQFQLVGATATNALGLLTPTADAITTPNAILKSDTNGDLSLRRLSISDWLIHAGDPDTYMELLDDNISFNVGGLILLDLFEGVQGLITIGPGGDVDIDFNSMMFLEGSSGNFAIGAAAPAASTRLTIQRSSGDQLRLAYDASNYTRFSVGASGTLDILAVGDIVLSPTGEDVLPLGSVDVDLGDYNRMWRTLFAAELYVETLIAQDVMATIGGRIMVAPTTKLIADVDGVQTTVDVEHNNLASGDFVLLKTAPGGVAQIEAMKITSAPTTITGGYRYSVARNQDGTGANSWVTGDAVANLGSAAGEGYIELTSTQTIHNHLGPNITIYSRSATTNWNDSKAVVSLGNLESFVDYATPEFGFAVANDLTLTPATGLKGLTADRTNGLRMFNTDIALYNSSTQTVDIASDGNAWFGANSSNKTLQITTTGANAGDVEVGDYSAGSDGVQWDESAGTLKVRGELRLEGSGNALIRAYASGIFAEDSLSKPSFALVNEDSIAWNGETLNTRDVLIGDNSASKANIFFDASAGEFLLRGGTTQAVKINTAGEIEAVSGSAKVQIKAAGVRFTSGGASPATVTNLEWYDPAGAKDVSVVGVAYDQVAFPAYIELRVGDNGVGSGLETFRLSRGAHATLSAALDTSDSIFVNDTGNAFMGLGVTINQGANDNEILSFKSSDVTHGMTSITETDTYGLYQKSSGANGGVQFRGFTADEVGVMFWGFATNGDTGKSATANAAVEVRASKKSGTTATNMGANENLFAIWDHNATRFLVDKEGDIHYDGTNNPGAWDGEDDTCVLRALTLEVSDPATIIRHEFDEFVRYHRDDLVKLGVLSEGGFINLTQVVRLLMGAAWQQHTKIKELEATLNA